MSSLHQVDAFLRKPNVETGIGKVLDSAPIFEIAGASVDSVKNNAGSPLLLERRKHPHEFAAADFHCRFAYDK